MKKLLVIIVFIITLELTIRMLYPYHDRLEKILNLLQQDSLLIWRQKPKLDILFEGTIVRTNSQGFRANSEYSLRKENDIVRIMCLGASPTFGWGVNFEDTYSQELKRNLKDIYPKNNFEVINAGVIGYSSYQGLLLLKNSISRYSPDIITVAYVINDIDRYRFFRSNGKPDKELVFINPIIIFLKNTFKKSRLYELIERGIINFSESRKFIPDIRIAVDFPQTRVSIGDYRNNLEEIINIARKNNIKLLFIKMPVNLPLPPYVDKTLKENAQNCISTAIYFMRHNQFREAISELQKAISLDPCSPETYFYQGICYNQVKAYDRAGESFKKAKTFAAFNCRLDSEKYNIVMQEVAGAYQVPLVDIVLKFKEHDGNQLFIDPKFDPIHPNKLGHSIIAEEIFNTMKQYSVSFID